MKLLPSDPDIQTIVGRIRRKELDLQPDFQRGEVWPESKQRRLIDTILRDWHIPPIHVIERPNSIIQEVLDGQQRLAAIRDFVNGVIRVDGHIEPFQSDIFSAHNCTYETLPTALRSRFDRFPIRQFTLINFEPEEPGELFFRLNQPVSLTSAEQRNAFYGPVRQQVRSICERFSEFKVTEQFIGFSNSRMAYDDLIAKLCLSLERRSLRDRITASTITERYREDNPFSESLISRVHETIRLFGSCNKTERTPFKFNKATLFSWLCFTSRLLDSNNNPQTDILPDFLWSFENQRIRLSSRSATPTARYRSKFHFPHTLLTIFTDRASLRVSDVSSVLLRDAVLTYCFTKNQPTDPQLDIPNLWHMVKFWEMILQKKTPEESVLYSALEETNWGALQ